ncbi:MAG: FliH/SctL family protein [Panacagrimonas sp.]
MSPAREIPDFAPILSGDAVAAQAANWTLPNFDALLRQRNAPPPSARHLEDLEAEASREGHARGYADGYSQGASAARAEAARLRQLLQHLAAPLAELDAQTEQALVALTLELARRLVQQELSADPAKMLGIVRDAVGHLSQPARGLRVRLHPEDARVVAEHLEADDAGERWSIVADRQLMPGDCLVESDSARVDARLDTRQAQLAQRLLGDAA